MYLQIILSICLALVKQMPLLDFCFFHRVQNCRESLNSLAVAGREINDRLIRSWGHHTYFRRHVVVISGAELSAPSATRVDLLVKVRPMLDQVGDWVSYLASPEIKAAPQQLQPRERTRRGPSSVPGMAAI